MENQLIVYTPKRNIKKIVLRLFLGVFVSFSIFILAAFSSAAIFIRFKWNQTSGTNYYVPSSNVNNTYLNRNVI